jgi:O-acetyl-ADP-ribose deacetylase (regulator of RNase III)
VHNRRKTAIVYRIGDVFTAKRHGPTIIVFMINDVTPTWGGGVARQAARRYPEAQALFRKRFLDEGHSLDLGHADILPLNTTAWLAPIVAQKGLGPSAVARIRYAALRIALRQVAKFARTKGAIVRMPRIGCGSAGGRWLRVAETILNAMRDVSVEVFDLRHHRT